MAVIRVETYGDVLKVVLKPTRKFPNGYFYTDNNPVALELINNYSWCLAKKDKNTYVLANVYGQKKLLLFHREYAKRVLGYYPDYLDHINGLEIDNRDENLNIVSQQQNARNRPTIGYKFERSRVFRPNYILNSRLYCRGIYKSEPEALVATYNLREEIYSDYNYNFLEDRRDFEDLLEQEIKGILSHEETIFIRVTYLILDNPWYVYRYNLFDYCKNNNIVIPPYELDNQGFMISPVTKQRLCPY